ncbi:MAG: hypothetical protein PWQ55_2178 [Chloroflexota bacterium]|nr:hypothetical protein [Chloroflexota bacterium]
MAGMFRLFGWIINLTCKKSCGIPFVNLYLQIKNNKIIFIIRK